MYEMISLAEKIGIPSLSAVSIGTVLGADKLVNSSEWQLVMQSIGALAGLTAIVWGVMRIVERCKKIK